MNYANDARIHEHLVLSVSKYRCDCLKKAIVRQNVGVGIVSLYVFCVRKFLVL